MSKRFTKASYTRRSYADAVRRGDHLARQLNEVCGELIEARKQLTLLAKLAVASKHGPQFFNPLEVFAAQDLAERVLGGPAFAAIVNYGSFLS